MKFEHLLMSYIVFVVARFFYWAIRDELRFLQRRGSGMHQPHALLFHRLTLSRAALARSAAGVHFSPAAALARHQLRHRLGATARQNEVRSPEQHQRVGCCSGSLQIPP